MDPAPTTGHVSPDEPVSTGDGVQVRIAELIDETCGLRSGIAGDWGAAVALKLVEQLIPPEQLELRFGESRNVQTLNLALYQMSYEAALACEHARQAGAQARRPATRSEPLGSTPEDPLRLAENLQHRLRLVAATGSNDSGMTTVETVGQLARLLCLCLIDAHEARDRYDYVGMQAVLDACDGCLPSGCTLKSFRVLECLRTIAQAGLSRDPGGNPPSRRDLEALAGLVSTDRERGGGSYADYSLLLLVVAVGHAHRQALVDNAGRDVQLAEHVDDALSEEADEATSIVAWVLDVLQDLEDRGVAQARDWPIAEQPNPMAHHVHYYRHFAHHIQAMALANKLKHAAATPAEDTTTISVSDVKREYLRASVSLERALQLVPPSNEARWRYYDLNAENLEREASLRIELLEQRLSTRQTVESLAEATVDRFSKSAQEELRGRMADVSMRVVEVIGIFLAVVAILGVTVASATVDGLSLSGRIWLLSIGGAMPVVYFVLLRWIVIGKLSKRRSIEQGSAQ